MDWWSIRWQPTSRRGSVCYLRRKIPQDLIQQYGRQEIVRSLHTKDRAQAERLLRRASVELDDEFAQRRGEATSPSVEPTIAPPVVASGSKKSL
ncbi:DUF6538 domain-containing protein [Cupriavidus sp. 2TAF22]